MAREMQKAWRVGTKLRAEFRGRDVSAENCQDAARKKKREAHEKDRQKSYQFLGPGSRIYQSCIIFYKLTEVYIYMVDHMQNMIYIYIYYIFDI